MSNWTYDLKPDGTLTHSGCPECGKSEIVNARVYLGVQFVSHEKEGQVEPDEQGMEGLEHATCGHCGTVLFER